MRPPPLPDLVEIGQPRCVWLGIQWQSLVFNGKTRWFQLWYQWGRVPDCDRWQRRLLRRVSVTTAKVDGDGRVWSGLEVGVEAEFDDLGSSHVLCIPAIIFVLTGQTITLVVSVVLV